MGPIASSILYNLDLEQLFVKCPEGQFAKFVQNTLIKQAFRNDNLKEKFSGTTVCTQKRLNE